MNNSEQAMSAADIPTNPTVQAFHAVLDLASQASKARSWDEGYRQAVTDVLGPDEEVLDWQKQQNPYRSES